MKKRMFLVSIIALLVDIISKRLIINNMLVDESISLINNFFSITYVRNTGVAFSFLDGHIDFIVIMTVIIILLMFKYIKNNNIKSNIEVISYGIILGGALGNLIDRVIYGYVIDFLEFDIFGYDAPIFNFADTFIVVGVIMLIIFNREVGVKNEFNSK